MHANYSCAAQVNLTQHQLANLLYHHMQGQLLEIQAILIAVAACWVPPLSSLNRHKPQQHISGRYGLALLASMACCLQLAQILGMGFLSTTPWFQQGTGSSDWVSISVLLCRTDTPMPQHKLARQTFSCCCQVPTCIMHTDMLHGMHYHQLHSYSNLATLVPLSRVTCQPLVYQGALSSTCP